MMIKRARIETNKDSIQKLLECLDVWLIISYYLEYSDLEVLSKIEKCSEFKRIMEFINKHDPLEKMKELEFRECYRLYATLLSRKVYGHDFNSEMYPFYKDECSDFHKEFYMKSEFTESITDVLTCKTIRSLQITEFGMLTPFKFQTRTKNGKHVFVVEYDCIFDGEMYDYIYYYNYKVKICQFFFNNKITYVHTELFLKVHFKFYQIKIIDIGY